jgi:hypothetical protein
MEKGKETAQMDLGRFWWHMAPPDGGPSIALCGGPNIWASHLPYQVSFGSHPMRLRGFGLLGFRILIDNWGIHPSGWVLAGNDASGRSV